MNSWSVNIIYLIGVNQHIQPNSLVTSFKPGYVWLGLNCLKKLQQFDTLTTLTQVKVWQSMKLFLTSLVLNKDHFFIKCLFPFKAKIQTQIKSFSVCCPVKQFYHFGPKKSNLKYFYSKFVFLDKIKMLSCNYVNHLCPIYMWNLLCNHFILTNEGVPSIPFTGLCLFMCSHRCESSQVAKMHIQVEYFNPVINWRHLKNRSFYLLPSININILEPFLTLKQLKISLKYFLPVVTWNLFKGI